jgi:DNA repair exonuclease SbcCD ATPase subunit
MKFKRLKINNFLAIGQVVLELNDLGLVLIQGLNEDEPSASSNGAGKSTLGDALSWVLFGKTARGLSADAVVNRTVGKNTLVELEV